jgi:hypothetical protein
MMSQSSIRHRRGFLQLAALFFREIRLYGKDEFWNYKEPIKFSENEKTIILTNSPWARTVHCEPPGLKGVPRMSSNSGGNGHGHGAVLVTPRPPGPDAEPPLAFYGDVVIRWESAKPVLQISGTVMPDELRNHHVISVTGLPAALLPNAVPSQTPSLSADLYEGKHNTESAEFVAMTKDRMTVLFGFPTSGSIGFKHRKPISFVLLLSGVVLKAKFEPAKMIYQDRLSV